MVGIAPGRTSRCVLRRVAAYVFGLVAFFAKATALPGRRFAAVLLLGGLGLAGCAQQPQQLAASGHGKEYFPSSVYGNASRRVVTDGPVPHGGGQYLVGKPYTVAGQTYYPSERKQVQVGNASWYGDAFHGRLTANGEIYDRDSFTAAHPTMPLPSYARVTNLRTNASMIVRVNDRGPFASNRIMDVSRRVAEALDFRRTGTAKVKVEYVGRASLAGSDDAKLFATLRTNGPAQWNESEPTMVASVPAPARVASLVPMAPAPAEGEMPREERRETAEAIAAPPRVHRVVRSEPSNAPAPPQRGAAFAANEHQLGILLQHGRGSTAGAPRASARAEPMPPARSAGRTVVAQAPLPPSRHLDLGTIPGAGVPIGAFHRGKPALRLSRND